MMIKMVCVCVRACGQGISIQMHAYLLIDVTPAHKN